MYSQGSLSVAARRSKQSFQLHHLPNSHFEELASWVERTMSENPVETLHGIHDMVCGGTHKVVCHLCNC